MRYSFAKILLGLAFIGVSGWLLFNLYTSALGIGEHGDATVPDLNGKNVREAKQLLEKQGLTFYVSRSEYHEKIAKDYIISQDPDAGMRVKKGRSVQVVVSNGPHMTQVPDLKGLDLREATLQLGNGRLKSGNIQFVTHPVAKRNVVVDQFPVRGKDVQYNSPVDITVSSGPPPEMTMPRLTNLDLTQAKTIVQSAKLRIGQVAWRLDSQHPTGHVLTQNPSASSKVHEGDMVSLVVSAGDKAETLPFKQSYITVLLPLYDEEQEVSIWITDETSTNLAYRGLHHGREKLELMVSGYGSSKIEVYVGSKLLTSGQL